ncbi:hypothetical protein L195_g064273, partial [Trifolium pratense]
FHAVLLLIYLLLFIKVNGLPSPSNEMTALESAVVGGFLLLKKALMDRLDE